VAGRRRGRARTRRARLGESRLHSLKASGLEVQLASSCEPINIKEQEDEERPGEPPIIRGAACISRARAWNAVRVKSIRRCAVRTWTVRLMARSVEQLTNRTAFLASRTVYRGYAQSSLRRTLNAVTVVAVPLSSDRKSRNSCESSHCRRP
jgi:hypothetical protein